MSAFIVSEEHIDALLRAGLERGPRRWDGALRWFAPEPHEDSDYERGEPWGRTATEHAQRIRRELTADTCNETGRMLLMENARSVAHRYDEPINSADLPGPVGLDLLAAVFPVDRVTGLKPMGRSGAVMMRVETVKSYTPVEVLSLISCYEYQSCEHPGWESSEAKAFCDALRHEMIRRLPGYDEAPWSI